MEIVGKEKDFDGWGLSASVAGDFLEAFVGGS